MPSACLHLPVLGPWLIPPVTHLSTSFRPWLSGMCMSEAAPPLMSADLTSHHRCLVCGLCGLFPQSPAACPLCSFPTLPPWPGPALWKPKRLLASSWWSTGAVAPTVEGSSTEGIVPLLYGGGGGVEQSIWAVRLTKGGGIVSWACPLPHPALSPA